MEGRVECEHAEGDPAICAFDWDVLDEPVELNDRGIFRDRPLGSVRAENGEGVTQTNVFAQIALKDVQHLVLKLPDDSPIDIRILGSDRFLEI